MGGGNIRSYRLPPANVSCVRLLAEEKLWQHRLGVQSEVYLCDAMNAFAEPSGEVYLGQPLIDQLTARSGQGFAFQAGGFVVAHEYSHEFQFRILKERGKQITGGPRLELQADMLGGYWVGMRLKEQKDALEKGGLYGEIERISSIAKKMGYDLGDYIFNSPQHHGTPKQRYEAVSAGLLAGSQAKFGSPEQAFQVNRNKIYDWSADEIEQLLGGRSERITRPSGPKPSGSPVAGDESDHRLDKFAGLSYGASEEDVLGKFGKPESDDTDNLGKEWLYFGGYFRVVVGTEGSSKGKVKIVEVSREGIDPLKKVGVTERYFRLITQSKGAWETEFGAPIRNEDDEEAFRPSSRASVTFNSSLQTMRVRWYYE